MTVLPLFSSSSGNSCIIKNNTTKIIIDVGISYKKLTEIYNDVNDIDAIFVTHSHSDHISGVGILARKINSEIYIHKNVYEYKKELFNNCKLNHNIEHDVPITIKDLIITPVETRHDVPNSYGYVITDKLNNKKFTYLTDTGSITKSMKMVIQDCDAYLLETDYDDDELIKTSEYDQLLKDRISSPFGHLSNTQTIDYIKNNINLDKISFIIFGHMSKVTNSKEILESKLKESFDSKYLSKFHFAPFNNSLEI